jgi:2-polyprenyl-6-hydroxyphenyl methylase/3-demethylubiquinone-9 3-methyltransferase
MRGHKQLYCPPRKNHTKIVSSDTTKAIFIKGYLNQIYRMKKVGRKTSASKSDPKTAQTGSTIDSRDIARFDALAKEWWDPNGAMRPLHLFTPARIDYLLRTARHAGLTDKAGRLENREVLDIGCGGGLLAEPIARLGAKLTAIDASEGAITAATAHASQQNLVIDYRQTSSEILAADKKYQARFDFIYASEVIEHVTDRPAFLAAMVKMLKPDGVIAITTINKSLPSLLLAKFAAEYLLRIVPAGTHQFSQFVSPQTLRAECEEAGILIDDITGFAPDLTGGFRMTSVTAVNYGLSGQLR